MGMKFDYIDRYVYTYPKKIRYSNSKSVVELTKGTKFYFATLGNREYIALKKSGPYLRLSEASVLKLSDRAEPLAKTGVITIDHADTKVLVRPATPKKPKEIVSFRTKKDLRQFFSSANQNKLLKFFKAKLVKLLDNRTDQAHKTVETVQTPSFFGVQADIALRYKDPAYAIRIRIELTTSGLYVLSVIVPANNKNPRQIARSQVVKDTVDLYESLAKYLTKSYGMKFGDLTSKMSIIYNIRDYDGPVFQWLRRFQTKALT